MFSVSNKVMKNIVKKTISLSFKYGNTIKTKVVKKSVFIKGGKKTKFSYQNPLKWFRVAYLTIRVFLYVFV